MIRIARMSLFLALAALLVIPSLAAADENDRQAKIDSNQTPIDWSRPKVNKLDTPIRTQGGNRAFGTIQYDTGTVTGTPNIGSVTWGNQFNTADGNPVTANGSVTQVQFYMAGADGFAFVSMYGPVGGGTTASVIVSSNLAVVTGFNTLPFNFGYTGPSFLLGVWADGSPITDMVGVDSAGTVGGQGFHGMVINDIVGTGFQTLPSSNVIMRPTGNLVVPVELMSFSVDEN